MLSISAYCRRHILPSCLVVGKDIYRMKIFYHEIFALKTPYFVLLVFFWLNIVKCEALLSPRG